MSSIAVVEYHSELYPAVLHLRRKVLREPLGMGYSDEELLKDRETVYFAYIEEGEVRGVVGMEGPVGHVVRLKQMAVDAALQGKGIGRKLVAALEAYAKERGATEIILDARWDARDFYNKLGYSEYGEEYTKIGLRHINTRKYL